MVDSAGSAAAVSMAASAISVRASPSAHRSSTAPTRATRITMPMTTVASRRAGSGPPMAGASAGSTPVTNLAALREREPRSRVTQRTPSAARRGAAGDAPMDLDMHQAIAGKLEAGKLAGWLSEYLVAWQRPSGHLEPEVTVWRTPDQNDETIKAYLSGLLSDLVPARGIVIAD